MTWTADAIDFGAWARPFRKKGGHHTSRYGAAGAGVLAVLGILIVQASAGDKKYGPGVSDTEIKIGNTSPYSGPASAFSMVAKAEAAYFRKINAEGGINGRKIASFPTMTAIRRPRRSSRRGKLVESDEVLLAFNAMGTATNSAVQKYLNAKKVPQLFVSSGAAKWNDPQKFPWTMGFAPSYETEGRIYAKYLLREQPGCEDRDPVTRTMIRQGLHQGNKARASATRPRR